jgi:16S rRNA (cytidine1402-2'-O)-methyltransferase
VQAVLAAGHEVVAVPGPSAVLAALVSSGLPAERFAFLGFPPRKGQGRRSLLARVAGSAETIVVFESPERLVALLEELGEACGPERRVAVGRELTKLHETVVRGTMAEVARYYRDSPARGEVTVVVEASPPSGGPDEGDLEVFRALARQLLEEGAPPSRAARELARRLGLSRNLAYDVVQEVKDA